MRANTIALFLGAFAGAAIVATVALVAAEKTSGNAELLQRIARLEQRAQRSDDYIAISNLQRSYGYYVDKAQADQAADLFAKDATLEIAGRGVFKGNDRIRAYMKRLPPLREGTLFNHMQLQPVIHIAEDGKTAQGRWRAFIQAGMVGRYAQWGEGTYENEYVREDGVWKIKKLHFYPTYYINFNEGWDKPGVPLFGAFKDFPPDAPPTEKYESYPGIYVPKYHYPNPVSGRR
jgi:hypothetical protein